MGQQNRQRTLGDALEFQPGRFHLEAGEMIRQRGDVVDAVAERRHADFDDGQAIVEIAPEPALPAHRAQRVVRCRNETDIENGRLLGSEPKNLVGLERAKQLRLRDGLRSPISSRNIVPLLALSSAPW